MKRLIVAALSVGLVMAAAPARTAELDAVEGNIVAGPGSFAPGAGTYFTPEVVVRKGQPATFYNYDIAPHDVVAEIKKRRKPIFKSALINVGQSAPVVGVEKLRPGSYDFYCSRHHYMQGELVVL